MRAHAPRVPRRFRSDLGLEPAFRTPSTRGPVHMAPFRIGATRALNKDDAAIKAVLVIGEANFWRNCPAIQSGKFQKAGFSTEPCAGKAG